MNAAELHRQLQNLLQIGTIAEVKPEHRQCRVQIGKLLTGWLDMPAEIGANSIRWQPLRVGTQVLLASPGGDLSAGVIVAMLFSNALPPPTTSAMEDVIAFDDGTQVSYNSDSGVLTVKSKSKIHLDCPEIDLGEGALEPSVLGDQLATWISATLMPWMNNHTHMGNLGAPTSPASAGAAGPFDASDAASGGAIYSTKNRSQ